jgi:hypothetical protein
LTVWPTYNEQHAIVQQWMWPKYIPRVMRI